MNANAPRHTVRSAGYRWTCSYDYDCWHSTRLAARWCKAIRLRSKSPRRTWRRGWLSGASVIALLANVFESWQHADQWLPTSVWLALLVIAIVNAGREWVNVDNL